MAVEKLRNLVISPSTVMSSYCYSVLKVEPYAQCEFSCTYCYGRWYRLTGVEGPLWVQVEIFERVAKFLRRRNLRTIPFRLSTLVEPFPSSEERVGISRRILEVALRYRVPLVISTKSVLLRRDPWRSLVLSLAEQGLVLLQITITTLRSEVWRVLEPRAPLPEERLRCAEDFSREGVPVVLRLQPLLALDPEEQRELLESARAAGVRHVIVEFLRCLSTEVEWYRKLVPELPPSPEWEPYSFVTPHIVKPPLYWRVEVLRHLTHLCRRCGLGLTTCKEGLYQFHTEENCCGLHYLSPEYVVLRPTLAEYYQVLRERGPVPPQDFLKIMEESGYLTGQVLRRYPRVLSRGLRKHEKYLLKVISRPQLLRKLLPLLNGETSRSCSVGVVSGDDEGPPLNPDEAGRS